MIRLEQINKCYGSTIAVVDLSMEVNDGEVCVLIGPSGCGKTTTLRMINRLIQPDSGQIFIDKQDTASIKPHQLRRSIGYVIQSIGLFPHMTVAENIAVVPKLLRWEKDRIAERIDELLTLVGLSPAEYGPKYPNHLSGGEAQRIGVARALASDPPILLMDEPFGAVDPLTRERLQAEFVNIQEKVKKTVIMVTHDLDEAIRLADRIAVMESGKLVQYDSPEEILSRPANKFVHDFVGTDRALKRLSRIKVSGFVRPAISVVSSTVIEDMEPTIEKSRFIWVTESDGRLIGWLDTSNLLDMSVVSEAMHYRDVNEIAISCSATLKETLSRILGQGFKTIPVVDDEKRLIGEVSLSDVEAATMESEG